ncbi:MAG: flippase-like domain-containing protein [Desulfobulbaceae bacterium]|nr:flippase-like domain-containing protein [Candidatus Kapabacteria bacterium]MBS4001452.1 flippase-like domain-containing protein [Desulfobulbaceae bacterium]
MRLNKKLIKYTLATAILILSLYLSARQIAFDELFLLLQELDYVWILLSVPVLIASNYIRVLRWKIILAPISTTVKTHNAFSAIMIGHLMNSFTLRFGEITRPIILAKKEKLPIAAVISTSVIESGVDFVFLIIVFIISLAFLSEPLFKFLNFDSVLQGSIGMVLIFILVSSFIFILYRFHHQIWHWLKTFLPVKFAQILEDSISSFVQGFVTLKSPKFYVKMTLHTIFLWLIYALVMYLVFFAFPFQTVIQLTFVDSILVVVFAGIANAIAFTPGSVGVYHLIVANIMTALYLITLNEAFAYATIIHIINTVVLSFIGAIYFVIEGISSIRLGEIKKNHSVG